MWKEILIDIYEILIYPLLGAVALYVTLYLKNKSQALIQRQNNDDLEAQLNVLNTIVDNCVLSTKQAYVDNMKKNGSFDETAQKMVFKITYDAVMASLTEETKKGLSGIIKDLPKYISDLIEARVHINK